MLTTADIVSIIFLLLISCISADADFCVKSVFLHSVKPLNPSSKLFCIVNQNEKISSIKPAPFRTISHFRKYLTPRNDAISFPEEEIMEIWDDEKAIPFEYPAAIFSDRCTGTAPLPLFKNTSITCLPDWDDKFDKKHCIDLKYINVSYYLHKYSTKKNNNRTIVSMESIPEKNHPVYWLHWNGTACINAVSSILIKFITHDGILEDISANVHYANITNQSYSRQSYRFDAIFIEISSTSSNTMRIAKPIGYDMGQIIEIDNEKEFLIPYGMECDDREQQVNIRFGIQINTACRLRITTCAQLLTQIQYLLDKWNSIIVYGLPNNKNETITMQNDRLSSSQMKKMDESCEITTALSMQFAYVRFGNVLAYSHRLISYKIELNKPDIIDLTIYPYQYIYFNFIVYFVDHTAAPVQLFAKMPTINIALPPDFFYPFFTKTLV
ncbi:Tectonic-1 [Dirofilaria immitis]